jgi:ferrous iron transport protein B
MSSCCDTSETKTLQAEMTVALAGNPNSGKTTVFNALTGMRQKVANYPGVTVEKKTGRCKLGANRWANVIDLPGTYSLISRSPDEQVAMEVLRGLRADTPAPDVVIVVVDASNLQRNLYLVSQLIELGHPLVIALNMIDIAERRGLLVSAEKLEGSLGVPVIPVVGHKRKGIVELKSAIDRARIAPLPEWPLPDAMREELTLVGGGLAILNLQSKDQFKPEAEAVGDAPGSSDARGASGSHHRAIAERLLIGDHASDLDALSQHEPVKSLLSSAGNRLRALGIDPMQADIEAHYRWIDEINHRVVGPVKPQATKVLDYAQPRTLTQKVDAILVHKIWGLLIFAFIMGALFVSLFWAAQPIMDGLQKGIDWLGQISTKKLADGPLKDLLVSGVFKGVGAVIVFVPQIALLFLFLSILEDTGYLARAAFLMDRLLAKVGLHGKSFIPLLSSFACAIPGIMATRTIESRKDRLATILVAPFMSCSARLPVYTLLIGTFFASFGAWAQAGVMLACYALGIVAAAGTAFVFKRSFLKGAPTTFILELPTYKVPQASQVGRQVWSNTWAFITKAGTTIFCLSIVLWAMAYYPRLPGIDNGSRRDHQLISDLASVHTNGARLMTQTTAQFAGSDKWENVKDAQQRGAKATEIQASTTLNSKEKIDQLFALTNPDLKAFFEKRADQEVAGEQLSHSLAGRMGHGMEPILKPLGFDWKMGVGLVGAFAAREVFVSTMGIIYSVGEVERGQTQGLAGAMRQDHYANGKPVWTPLVAVSLLVWFVLAMQCMSTVAIIRRETGGWRWPIFMIVYMNGLAYVASLAVFQVGRVLLHA